MNGNYTYIDFDGVILDSEERMLDRKYSIGLHNHKDANEFNEYLIILICIQKNGIIL